MDLAAVGIGFVGKAMELDTGTGAVRRKRMARVATSGVGHLRDARVLENRHLNCVATVLEGTGGIEILHLGVDVCQTQGLGDPRQRARPGVFPSPMVTRLAELLMGSVGRYLAVPCAPATTRADTVAGVSYRASKSP